MLGATKEGLIVLALILLTIGGVALITIHLHERFKKIEKEIEKKKKS